MMDVKSGDGTTGVRSPPGSGLAWTPPDNDDDTGWCVDDDPTWLLVKLPLTSSATCFTCHSVM